MTTSILQLVALDETGDSYYRMRWPGKDLSLQTGWSVVNLDARAEERFALAEQADLLVLFQSEDLELVPIIERRRSAGKHTLAEYNDNFYATSAWFPVHHAWSSPLLWQKYELLATLVDAVIVTGESLADELRHRISGQHFYPIKNYLPMVPPSFEESLLKKYEIPLVGWGGSFGHLADLLHYYPLIHSALKIAGRGSFACMGNRALPDLCKVLKVEEAPLSPDTYVPWGSMQEYFTFLSTLHIGVIPLCRTAYNNCRSDIKAVEMAAFGAAPLVPELPPYHEFIAATGCPSYSSEENFISALVQLLRDDTYRLSVAERARRYVTAERVGIHSRIREDIYRKFLPGEVPQSLSWPYGTGYYEECGTPPKISKTKMLLDDIDALLRKSDFMSALQTVDAVDDEFAQQPDVLIRRIQMWLHQDKARAYTEATQAFSKFPRDVRFLVGMIRTAPSKDRENEHLETLSRLLRECANSQKFFQGIVVKLVASLDTLTINMSEVFSALYPSSVELQVNLAERARRLGDRERALHHFTLAEEAVKVLEMNGSVPDTVDVPYIRMWVSALS
jgi:hypothetical protein